MATIKTDGKTFLEENEKRNATSSGMINFEADQQDAMKKTEGIQSLADQVERLELCDDRIADIENDLKMMKKKKN